MKYNPEITLGNILAIVSVVLAASGAYATYRSDQAVQDNKIAVLEKERVNDRADVREQLNSIQKTADQTNTNLQSLREAIATINGKMGTRQAP